MRSRQPTRTTAEAHVELALRFLEEGKGLVDKDPVQPVRSFTRLPRRLLRRWQFTSI